MPVALLRQVQTIAARSMFNITRNSERLLIRIKIWRAGPIHTLIM